MIINWDKINSEYLKWHDQILYSQWSKLPLELYPWNMLINVGGIYSIFNKKKLLYIGNTIDFYSRLNTHIKINKKNVLIFRPYYEEEIVSKIIIARLEKYYSEEMEKILIHKFKPECNKRNAYFSSYDYLSKESQQKLDLFIQKFQKEIK